MNRKLHMLMLASIATMQCYATNETVDTLKTYELHDVTVTSTRAGKHTPMAYSSLDKNQIKKLKSWSRHTFFACSYTEYHYNQRRR